jgi:ADP-heptose:LPS heptosyltransferase
LKVRYLIIRFSSIGDIVLTSPVVRCLKQQVEGAEVHFVTKRKFASLVASNPYVDKVHLFSGNINELNAELNAEKFDYVIDLHNNFRSNRIKYLLRVNSFAFQKLNIEKFLYVNFKINRLPNEHVVDRYMKTLHLFDVINDEKGLDFFIPEKEDFDVERLPAHFRSGYIAFVIAGTWNTKKLPSDKVIEICNRINQPVVLLGGKSEEETGIEIQSQSKGNIFNLAGKLSLNQSASLVRDANLVITNDTGLMHIAAAFKKKILSFWGNTVPQFGMSPYLPHPDSELMEVKDLNCRPCSKLGYRSCPRRHFGCMKNQDIDKAVSWINRNFNTEE